MVVVIPLWVSGRIWFFFYLFRVDSFCISAVTHSSLSNCTTHGRSSTQRITASFIISQFAKFVTWPRVDQLHARVRPSRHGYFVHANWYTLSSNPKCFRERRYGSKDQCDCCAQFWDTGLLILSYSGYSELYVICSFFLYLYLYLSLLTFRFNCFFLFFACRPPHLAPPHHLPNHFIIDLESVTTVDKVFHIILLSICRFVLCSP